jgi:hypothetical protein
MSSTHTKADYKKSTHYEDSAAQVRKREERNKARYDMKKKVGAKALVGKDVDHHDPLRHGGSNKPSNWDLRGIKSNRGDNKS